MFQSSRIASGKFFLHELDRFLAVFGFDDLKIEPFKDSSCHLSDDTRVIDDQAGFHSLTPRCAGEPALICCSSPSSGDRFGGQVEHPIDIEDDHELTVEPEHARRNAGELAIEINRIRLAFAVG